MKRETNQLRARRNIYRITRAPRHAPRLDQLRLTPAKSGLKFKKDHPRFETYLTFRIMPHRSLTEASPSPSFNIKITKRTHFDFCATILLQITCDNFKNLLHQKRTHSNHCTQSHTAAQSSGLRTLDFGPWTSQLQLRVCRTRAGLRRIAPNLAGGAPLPRSEFRLPR